MADFNKKGTIIISCPLGIAPYLSLEVEKLGFEVKNQHRTAVEIEGSLKDTIKLNYHLRTAHRVLYQLHSFDAANTDELYKSLVKLKWDDQINKDGYFSVSSSIDRNIDVKDTRIPNLICKDAIADSFKKHFGKRPDSGSETDKGVNIFLFWKEGKCDVFLDTSGDSLAKHGYRLMPYKAPLQETLAAAMLIAADWNPDMHLVNPMCGSGTLAIEAALMAQNIPSAFKRSQFAFCHIPGYEENFLRAVIEEAHLKIKNKINCKIIATDNNRQAMASAQKNAHIAGVTDLIDFYRCDFSRTHVPEGKGLVIFNPEYGERMGEDELERLEEVYKKIGDFMKQNCAGYTGAVLTGNPDLAKKIGLKPKRRIELFNAKIECRLLLYELYEGKGGNFE